MNIRDTRCLLLNAERASMAIGLMDAYEPRASTLPAPAAMVVLRYLDSVASQMLPVLDKIGDGLRRSFGEYDFMEESGRDPVDSVLIASDHLERSKILAAELASELQAASGALSGQHPRPQQPRQETKRSEAANLFCATRGGVDMSANDRITYSRLLSGRFGSAPPAS